MMLTAEENSGCIDLLPCPQCGSMPCQHDPDWGSVSEYYGVSDQSVSITCSGANKTHCPVSVDISIDPDLMHAAGVNGDVLEDIAAEAWNAVARAHNNQEEHL